ncbi:MAG: hypothetical protein ACI80N_004354, partial [Gammaproteobacteria bacterium]
ASATCLSNFALRKGIAVIAVGKGVGAAQSFLDTSGNNRRRIFNGLMLDRTPDEILDLLQGSDPGHNTRQYGIVSLQHGAATFTGGQAGFARFGVTGEQGSMVYAIQGNVLAGVEVVTAAETALLAASGDLGQRVMAGMEAARALGGDGRCSCSSGAPASCGAPPPGFTKSAHTAFIVLARIGDLDGTCSFNTGCANGSYYLGRRFIGGGADPDPVIVLQERYDVWRLTKVGEVDELLTEVSPTSSRLVADGVTTVDVRVRLRDIDGNPLALGGQTLELRGIGGAQPATLQGIVDHGDGSHTITMRAGIQTGRGVWRVLVDTGAARQVVLHPPLTLHFDPVTPIHAGLTRVSAADGADVELVLNVGAAKAGRTYQILAGYSGTTPGSMFHGGMIPLNLDRLVRFTAATPGAPLFPGSLGVIDADGRAQATIHLSSDLLTRFIGSRFDFVGVVFGNPDDTTGPTGFEILP